MPVDLNKLDEMLPTPEDGEKALAIMREYQDAISKMMADTVEADVRELIGRIGPQKSENVEQLANSETANRMSKYGQQFFNEEMERLMDSFNVEEYDVKEFNIRCMILTSLKDSLVEFEFE